MQNTRLGTVYLLLAGAGLVATWYFNLRFIEESGGVFSVTEFMRAGNANSAASSLANDLAVATLTFVVWSFVEARRLAIRHWWVFLVLTFTIAFALAFPLFLFVRERALRAREQGA